MFGQFAWKQETDCGLNLPGRNCGLLVVVGESGRLGGYSFEDVANERVHNAHGFAGDPGIRVDLLEDLVNVDGVAFLAFSTVGFFVGLLAGFLDCSFASCFDFLASWHYVPN